MKETIELILIGNHWLAKHSDPEVLRLFETDTIPTPFTAYADRDEVLQTIQTLNPGSFVFCNQ